MPALQLVIDSLPVLLQGTLLTIKFALWSMLFGLVLGSVVALMGISHSRALKAVAEEDGFDLVGELDSIRLRAPAGATEEEKAKLPEVDDLTDRVVERLAQR